MIWPGRRSDLEADRSERSGHDRDACRAADAAGRGANKKLRLATLWALRGDKIFCGWEDYTPERPLSGPDGYCLRWLHGEPDLWPDPDELARHGWLEQWLRHAVLRVHPGFIITDEDRTLIDVWVAYRRDGMGGPGICRLRRLCPAAGGADARARSDGRRQRAGAGENEIAGADGPSPFGWRSRASRRTGRPEGHGQRRRGRAAAKLAANSNQASVATEKLGGTPRARTRRAGQSVSATRLSGQRFLRSGAGRYHIVTAFTQQFSQFVGMYGAAGAVVGAFTAVIGAAVTGYRKFNEEIAKSPPLLDEFTTGLGAAKEQAEGYAKALQGASDDTRTLAAEIAKLDLANLKKGGAAPAAELVALFRERLLEFDYPPGGHRRVRRGQEMLARTAEATTEGAGRSRRRPKAARRGDGCGQSCGGRADRQWSRLAGRSQSRGRDLHCGDDLAGQGPRNSQPAGRN